MSHSDLPELSTFLSKEVIQRSVLKNLVTQHRAPLQTAQTCLLFDFTTAQNEYVAFDESYVYVRCKVKLTRTDTNPVKAEDWKATVPIQYLGNTMFRQAQLWVDGIMITDSDSNFMYKAYLEALLGYGESVKKSHLTSAMWLPEAERTGIVKDEAEFEMASRLHLDLANQSRPFPGGHSFVLKLFLNDPQFMFKTSNDICNVELEVKEAYFDVRRLIVSDSVMRPIQRKQIRMPINRTYVRAFPIKEQSLDVPLEDICRGKLPFRILFCLVSNKAYNGSQTTDPFEFKHYDIDHFATFVDGVQFPDRAYLPNFKTGIGCVSAYIGLMQALRQNKFDALAEISFKDFKSKFPIFAVNFTPDLSNGEEFLGPVAYKKEGTLRATIRFSKALPESVTALVMLEFDSAIFLDVDGSIHTN